jgi:hypothetical protein
VQQPRERVKQYIYAILSTASGNIKFGITQDVNARLKGMQTSNSDDLTLICAVRGSQQNEWLLHKALREYRLRGEWYSPTPTVLSVVELMKVNNQLPIELLADLHHGVAE